jgi:hypothetical protein
LEMVVEGRKVSLKSTTNLIRLGIDLYDERFLNEFNMLPALLDPDIFLVSFFSVDLR